MICSCFLREIKHEGHGVFYRAMERVFDGMLSVYAGSLKWVLRHRPVMLGMFLIVLWTTAYLYVIVPKGFITDPDNDNFNIQVEAAQGTSYYQMVKYVEMVSRIVVQDPDVESFYCRTGGGGGGGGMGGSSSTGNLMVNLVPRRQRKATVADIANRIRPKDSNF